MWLLGEVSHEIRTDGRWLIGLALLLATSPATADGVARQLDGTLAVEYDDNVAFGPRSRDELSDWSGHGRVDYRQLHELTPNRAWGFTAAVDTRQYVEWSRLGQVEVEIGPLWRQRFGAGFFAPIMELSLTGSRIESRSDIRTGSRWTAAARLRQRLSDRITGHAGLHHSQRRASDGDAFDQDRSGIFVHADYLLRAHRTAYTSLGWQTGDVAVTTDVGYAEDDFDPWADGEPDDAFGGADDDRFAFGVDADIVTLTIGYNHGFDRMRAIDASVQATRGSVSGGSDYDRLTLRIAYLHRFGLR